MEPFSYTLYLYTHVCMHAYSYQYVLYVYTADDACTFRLYIHYTYTCIYVFNAHMHTSTHQIMKPYFSHMHVYSFVVRIYTYINNTQYSFSPL